LKNPYLDEDIQPLALTQEDIDDVVAFPASLTSPEYDDQRVKELARQRAISRMTAARHGEGFRPEAIPSRNRRCLDRDSGISLGTPTSHGPLGHPRTDEVCH